MASSQPGRQFCHCCSAEISPQLPDYISPRCESGFIEELPEETRNTENSSNSATAPTDQNRQPLGSGQTKRKYTPFPPYKSQRNTEVQG
uniref:RING-type E3 ubiquitin transferase n=1 Tax=Monodelphis domestica TaxID=13616 RepID=A0A5F8G672_MONDO